MINVLWTVQLLFNLLIVLCLIVYIYTGDRKGRRRKGQSINEQPRDNSYERMRELAGVIEELVNAYDEKSQASLQSIDNKQQEIEEKLNKIQELEDSLRADLERIGSLEKKVQQQQDARQLPLEKNVDSDEEVVVTDRNRDGIPSLPRYREAMELYDQGVPPEQIAKKLKLGVGEVRLVIDLQRRKSVIPESMKGNFENVKRRL